MKHQMHPAVAPVLLVALCGTLLSSGCGGYFRQTRDHFDFQAKPAVTRAQTLNPEAGKNRKVVAGLDGAAATQASASYVKSFERQSPGKAVESFTGLSGIAN